MRPPALPSLAWSTCKTVARAAVTRALGLAHPTFEVAANAAGVDRSHLSRWTSDKVDHPAPLAALWSRALLPDAEFEALVEQARADRAGQREHEPHATAEGALWLVMQRAHALIGEVMETLRDNRATFEERARARVLLKTMVQDCRGALKTLDAADRAEFERGPAAGAGGRR